MTQIPAVSCRGQIKKSSDKILAVIDFRDEPVGRCDVPDRELILYTVLVSSQVSSHTYIHTYMHDGQLQNFELRRSLK